MERDYDWTMTKVFFEEGGYGWDKGDPGGPTNWGITCWDLAEYEGKKMQSMSAWAKPVKAMTKSTAEKIYAKKYKPAIRFDDLPYGVDCVIVDYGINSGSSRVIKATQKILGLDIDGDFGPETLKAIQDANSVDLINEICAERLSFMKSIRGGAAWHEFGKGWGARVARMKTDGILLAKDSGPPMDLKLGALDLFSSGTQIRCPKAYDMDEINRLSEVHK